MASPPELREPIDGLLISVNKAGRRFVMEGVLDRLTSNRSSKVSYYVYLFSDIIVFAKRSKKPPHKYVTHKYLANCLFIDYENSSKTARDDHTNSKIRFLRKEKKISLRYAFEIKHLDDKRHPPGSLGLALGEGDRSPAAAARGASGGGGAAEKEEYIFLAKNLDQKALWKSEIEKQINAAQDDMDVVADPSSRSSAFGESYVSGFSETESPSSYGSMTLSGISEPDTSSVVSTISPSDPSSVSVGTPDTSSISESADDSSYCQSGHWSVEDDTIDELNDLEISEKQATITGVAEDGSTVVRAASVNYIVWMLVCSDQSETSLAFLFNYRNFSTPSDLFDILKEVYSKNSPPKDLLIKYSHHDVRKKVANFFWVWVAKFFCEDFEEKGMYLKMLNFIADIRKEGQIHETNQIKLAILRAKKDWIAKRTEKSRKPARTLTSELLVSSNKNTGTLTGNAISGPTGSNKFSEFDITAVAMHLTYTDHMHFRQVMLSEFAKKAWQDKNSKKKAPNILLQTQKFNQLSQWVSTEIIQNQTPKLRAVMIERFVALASKCLEMRNYHTLMEVLAGINRGYVGRLKKSWGLVSSSTMETLQALNDLMDSKDNFKSYRESLRKSALPCLPYFGIFLRDMVFLEDGNEDKIEDLVNYDKLQMLGRLYKEVLYFQQKKYPPCEDEAIIAFFKPTQLWVMPDEVLYSHSRLAEPSAPRPPEDQ